MCIMAEDAARKEAQIQEAKDNLAKGREKRRLSLQKRKEEEHAAIITKTIESIKTKKEPLPTNPIPFLPNPPESSIAPSFTAFPPPLPQHTTPSINPFLTMQPSPTPKREREERPKPKLTKYEPPIPEDWMDVESGGEKKSLFDSESVEESQGEEESEPEIIEPPPKRKKLLLHDKHRPSSLFDAHKSMLASVPMVVPPAEPKKDLFTVATYHVAKIGIFAGSTLMFLFIRYITDWGISKVTETVKTKIWGKEIPIETPPPHYPPPTPNPVEDPNGYTLSEPDATMSMDEKKNPDAPYRLR